MRFRCPRCRQQVRVPELTADESEVTQEILTCPACQSEFSLLDGDDSTAEFPPGQKIGHFEVQSVLGEGSFGTVYKAWDPELQRTVAIKLPRRTQLLPETARKVLREARAAAAVSHPNVVAVHEVGQHEDLIYIACQFIEGVTLRDYLRAHVLTPEESAKLLIELLRAIQVFHDRGIIHRDLKPGNILLDTVGKPYVADFGLARHEDGGEQSVTHSGHIAGTLLYMSPEQARGEVRGVSNRTDIYAMGVILYEMLTGNRPFQSTSSQALIYHILTDDPTPPRRIKRQIPRDMETICLKALEKHADQRYASAAEMADDLQRFLDRRPIAARPAGIIRKTVKRIHRHQMLTVLLLITVAALAMAGYSWFQKPVGTVAVRLDTEPPGGSLYFVRFDENLRVPHEAEFRADGVSGGRAWLLPGLYKVYAEDEQQRFHEVWRFVPESPGKDSTEQRFPHRSWTISESGEVVLQPVTLFADGDVADPLVLVPGGTFEAGYEKTSGRLAGRHQQQVADFQLSVNEISYGQFRRVMNQPVKSPRMDTTYLAALRKPFGDRSMIPDNRPVTGFPADVAILYCELAGGRLPTNIEWEYAATLGGTASFPTGEQLAIGEIAEWSVMNVDEPTADTTSQGIRNLFASVAEYTDSRMLSYSVLYPTAFSDQRVTDLSRMDFSRMPEMIEVRGVPSSWLSHGTVDGPLDVRQRLVAPFPAADSDAIRTYERIGWRLCRSILRPAP
ncbi:MAG: bifunctional serine/threonine-protein kinase/formylglycine-generating enzyme family protein [Fuerstiella sp.]